MLESLDLADTEFPLNFIPEQNIPIVVALIFIRHNSWKGRTYTSRLYCVQNVYLEKLNPVEFVILMYTR